MLKVMKKKLLVVITMLVVASGFIFTGSTSTKAKDNDVKYLGKYKLTAYCGCRKCSGKWGARTASGKKAKQGRTIAVDKRKIKLVSKVQINGFFKSHKQTKRFGKKTGVKVYKVN